MKRILDLPDDLIAIRVQTRAGILRAAATEEGRVRREAQRRHAESELARAGLPTSLLESAPGLVAGFKQNFVPPSVDSAEMAKVRELRASAYEVLPAHIQSESWPAHCGCVVESIYLFYRPEEEHPREGYQTFSAVRCADHGDLSNEELRAALDRECALIAAAHGVLDDASVEFSKEWVGRGEKRALRIDSQSMTDECAAALSAAAVELGEPGAIKATVTRQE